MAAEVYEVFEHTADVGLRIAAPSFDELLAEAARGLFSLIVEELREVRPVQRIEIQIPRAQTTPAASYLLFDWLNELLYTFETRRLLLGEFRVKVENETLIGEAWGETIDPRRHRLDHEVKAITYHGLEVRQTHEGWEAQVIVDI